MSIRPSSRKLLLSCLEGKRQDLTHLRPFGCKCYILNIGVHLDNFDAKSELGIFVGYSPHSKAYKIFNRRTLLIQESIHVEFDEKKSATKHVAVENVDISGEHDDDLEINVENSNEQVPKEDSTPTTNEDESTLPSLPKDWKYVKDHPKEQILGDTSKGI